MNKLFLGQVVYFWDRVSVHTISAEVIELGSEGQGCTLQWVNKNGVVVQNRFSYSAVFASKRDCLVHWQNFYSNILLEINKQLGKADVSE